MRYCDIAKPWGPQVYADETETIKTVFSCSSSESLMQEYLIVMKGDAPAGVLSLKSLFFAVLQGKTAMTLEQLQPEPVGTVKADAAVNINDLKERKIFVVLDKQQRPIGHFTSEHAYEKILFHILESLKKLTEKVHLLNDKLPDGKSVIQAAAGGRMDQIDQLFAFLQENNFRLWKILKYSSDSIIVADRTGKSIFANKAFEASIARSEEEYIGMGIETLAAQGCFEPPVTPMVLKEKKPVTIQQRGSNLTKWWIATGVPIFDEDGELDMVVSNAKDLDECRQLVEYAEGKERRAKARTEKTAEKEMICAGTHMREIMALADKAAQIDSNVLITGKSGTGKSFVAKQIHNASSRSNQNFVEVNCSSIPDSLFESELFGYESGAFTGAQSGGKKVSWNWPIKELCFWMR